MQSNFIKSVSTRELSVVGSLWWHLGEPGGAEYPLDPVWRRPWGELDLEITYK
jgi:hypothetical protein